MARSRLHRQTGTERLIALCSFLLPFVAMLGSCPSAHASLVGSARAPGSYRTWTVEVKDDATETKVSQVHVPLITSLRLGSQVDWVFSTAIANSDWDAEDAAQQSVSGSSDLKSQIFYRLLGDRLLLQGGVNLPVAHQALTDDELKVVQLLGHPLLGFRMKHYGEGVNVSGGGAIAFPLGERATFALGGGFVQRGEYEFVEGEPDFKPGAESSVSAGLDFLSEDGEPFTRFDVSYRIYGKDESGGQEIFQEGNQTELQASLNLRPGRMRSALLVRGVLKDENEVLSANGDNVDAVAVDAGQSIFARYTLGIALSESSVFGFLADYATFSGSEVVQNDGHAWGVGPTFEQRLGQSGRLGLSALFLRGSTDGDEELPELDLSGLDVSMQLTWHLASK